MAAKRIDPTTGKAVTHQELLSTYKNRYTKREIEDQGLLTPEMLRCSFSLTMTLRTIFGGVAALWGCGRWWATSLRWGWQRKGVEGEISICLFQVALQIRFLKSAISHWHSFIREATALIAAGQQNEVGANGDQARAGKSALMVVILLDSGGKGWEAQPCSTFKRVPDRFSRFEMFWNHS